MSAKLIGIPGYKTETSFGAGLTHLEYISEFGFPRILMPHEETFEGIDALYLPGGLDINPSTYGKVPRFKTSNQDVFKQFFLDNRLDWFIQNRIPIFAVCMGAQALACRFGATLIQNLKYHPQSKDRWVEGHSVILKGGILKDYNEKTPPKDRLQLNSHHHQGIIIPEDNKELEVLAWFNDYDGRIVEVARHRTLPIVMCQHHPKYFGAC